MIQPRGNRLEGRGEEREGRGEERGEGEGIGEYLEHGGWKVGERGYDGRLGGRGRGDM